METHPGHGGIVPEYDELSEWLNEQIKALTPIPSLYAAVFRELPGYDELPVGILIEVVSVVAVDDHAMLARPGPSHRRRARPWHGLGCRVA